MVRRWIGSLAFVLAIGITVQSIKVPVATAAVQDVADNAAPSPGLALVLGLLIPGSGHFYAGESGDGLLILGLCIANWLAWTLIYACVVFFTLGCFASTLPLFVGAALVVHFCFIIWGGVGGFRAAKRAAKDDERLEKTTRQQIDTEPWSWRQMQPTRTEAF